MTPQTPVKSIFRKYDIRGIVGTTLNAEIIYQIGRGFGATLVDLGEHQVIMARDTRLSSPDFHQALQQALLDSGIDVTDLGATPTPLANFATHKLGITNAAIITGSHNPCNYNGLKLIVAGKPFHDTQLSQLYQRVISKDYKEGSGQRTERDIVPQYLLEIKKNIEITCPLRVAIDCGNGISGPVASKLLKALGCDVTELYCEPDGRFPNHHPNPSEPKNLRMLQETVVDRKLDLGLALDGDGDRLGVVDSAGKIIWPDRQLMLFARDILAKLPGRTIVYDVKSTRHLENVIREAGGIPLMVASGHSLLRQKIEETQAPLGGELSGHLFFNDRWYGFDDGLYTAARLLEILCRSHQSSNDLFATLPDSPSTPEITIDFGSEQKLQAFMEDYIALNRNSSDTTIIATDGLRLEYPHGWSLVRASNTSPSLSVRFEGDDSASLEQVAAQTRREILQVAPRLQLPF